MKSKYLANVAAKQDASRNMHLLSHELSYQDVKDNISAEATWVDNKYCRCYVDTILDDLNLRWSP